jgi:hypothetical protein
MPIASLPIEQYRRSPEALSAAGKAKHGEHLRRRGIGGAGGERRLRRIFHAELNSLRRRAIGELLRHHEPEIDAGGNAATGDAVAVDVANSMS